MKEERGFKTDANTEIKKEYISCNICETEYSKIDSPDEFKRIRTWRRSHLGNL